MQMKRVLSTSVVILLALILIGAVIALSGSANSANASPSSGVTQSQGDTPIILPPGAPAIPPTTNGTPAFSIADVRQYLQSHPFLGGPVIAGHTAVIETIQFMTAKEAGALLGGAGLGVPDNSLVCYAVWGGPFFLAGASFPPGEKIPTVQRGVEIFNAQNGYLLMWGVAP